MIRGYKVWILGWTTYGDDITHIRQGLIIPEGNGMSGLMVMNNDITACFIVFIFSITQTTILYSTDLLCLFSTLDL